MERTKEKHVKITNEILISDGRFPVGNSAIASGEIMRIGPNVGESDGQAV